MITLPDDDRENSRVEMVRSFGLIGEPRPAIHDEVAALARDLSGASTALVSLVDSQRNWFAGIANFPDADQCRWDSFCTHVVAAPDELLWVEDARTDFRFANNPYVLIEPFLRFYHPVHGRAKLMAHVREEGGLGLVGGFSFDLGRQKLCRVLLPLGDVADVGVNVSDAVNVGHRHPKLDIHRTAVLALSQQLDAPLQTGRAALAPVLEAPVVGLCSIWRDDDIDPLPQSLGASKAEKPLRASRPVGDHPVVVAVDQRVGGCQKRLAQRAHLVPVGQIVSHDPRKPLKLARERGIVGFGLAVQNAERAYGEAVHDDGHARVAVADLLAKTGLNPQQSELVSIIQSSSGQLLRLVGDILDLSRIESGEMVLVSSPMSLRDLIREVTGGLEVAASEKHLSLSVSIDPAVSEQVEGDATRLKQVLTNLVSNAIKFTESGSVTVTVRRAGEDVRFEVHDTGIGFSEEQRAVIFERFQQADGSITRKFGGTGLGLAISRELVAVMGGELDCCGSTGEGASFWFTLPLRPVATVAAPVENAAEVHTTNSRALVVDDNATNRRVAELLLQSVGTDVVSVEDGLQAVDAFRRERYDVILMDMMMPVMDGLAATETIRQIEAEQRLRHTPIIMLTASSLPEHITASMDAGADLHLLKPINAAALFDALNVVGNAESDENERPDAHADG